MIFSQYKNILLGMCLIGFSVGYVFGGYIIYETKQMNWIYLAAPLLGIGSGYVIVGVLYDKNK